VDEARGLKESVREVVADEARGVRELVTTSVVDEARAIREEARYARAATESELADLRTDVASVVEALRSEIVELTRMLRMQGDAADQLAETLGRTLARLSGEVEALGEAVQALDARLEGTPSRA
jgi:hypothetical protein